MNLINLISEFNEDFINSYNYESDERYFLEVEVQSPFLSERMKIEEFKKRIPNLRDKTEYVMHIRNWTMNKYWKKCIESLNLIKKFG